MIISPLIYPLVEVILFLQALGSILPSVCLWWRLKWRGMARQSPSQNPACKLSLFSGVPSLQPYKLYTARLLCPWYSLGKNTGGGLPCPTPRDLPNPGIKPTSLTSVASAGRFFTTDTTWEAPLNTSTQLILERKNICGLKLHVMDRLSLNNV